MFLFVNLEECPDGADVDKAVIDLSPAAARELLRRQDRVASQKREDDSLYCHEFFDGQCAFLSADDLRDKLEGVGETILGTEAVLDVLDQEDAVVAYPDDPEVTNAVEEVNCPILDCHTVLVTDTDFTWTALVKEDSRPVKTVSIPRSFIEQAAQDSAEQNERAGEPKP